MLHFLNIFSTFHQIFFIEISIFLEFSLNYPPIFLDAYLTSILEIQNF